ncbi:MAG: substrate-binding domain-containing protein [Pseudobutyrivibrio sp.]|nr:substrate-binding domain-containing protein [Pseudobutyrivibrio sp.]
MRKNKLLIGFFLALLGLIIVEYYIYTNYSKLTRETIKISFVVSDDNLDRWDNMQYGAEAAASDNDCIVTFVNSPRDAGPEGELDVISRQFSEGADYVAVASGYYGKVRELVKAKSFASSVIFVKTGNVKSDHNNLMVDEYSLGRDLAQHIIDAKESYNLLLLGGSESANANLAIDGLKDALDKSDIEYELALSKDSAELVNNVYQLRYALRYDGVVALDSATIDMIASKKDYLLDAISVYAIDNRQESVYYLDSSLVDALAYEDDYSLGYITVEHFLDGKSLTRIAKGVPLYYIVDKESMYSEQMEKVLFPFVK